MERIAVYDRAKGIGIVLLVLGHLATKSSPVFNAIFAFHMPLFLFVSGVFYHPLNGNYRIIVNKHILRHLVPFMFFSIIGLLVTLILSHTIITPPHPIPSERVLRTWMIESFISLGSRSCLMASLWYLPVFSASLLLLDGFNMIIERKIISNKLVFVLLLSCVSVMIALLREDIRLPLRIMTVFGTSLFIYLGYIYREDVLKYVEGLVWWKIILLLAFFISFVVLNGEVNISTPRYNNFIFFVTTALIGIFLTLYLSQHKSLRILEFFGKNSLIVFCMNSLWCEVYCMVLSKISGIQYIAMENLPISYALLGTLLVLLVSIPTVYVFNPIVNRILSKIIK